MVEVNGCYPVGSLWDTVANTVLLSVGLLMRWYGVLSASSSVSLHQMQRELLAVSTTAVAVSCGIRRM